MHNTHPAIPYPVIDLETSLPGPNPASPGRELSGPPGPDRLPPPPGYGFANYDGIFPRDSQAESGQAPPSVPAQADELIRLMDQSRVAAGVLWAASNSVTAQVVSRYPGRVLGIAVLSPFDGMRAVRELERLVRDEGLGALGVGALNDQVPASDRRYYPLYAKCVELDIPVRVYTAMTYANDRRYELGHPRHLDPVAIAFPELRIIAGLSGWPWVNEMVGLLRRHPNLYCDTAAHRPRHFATPGSGWEQFLQFGNTLLQDKIMVGLSWSLLGMTMPEIIGEYLDLPLKDTVKKKWLYENAARFLRIAV